MNHNPLEACGLPTRCTQIHPSTALLGTRVLVSVGELIYVLRSVTSKVGFPDIAPTSKAATTPKPSAAAIPIGSGELLTDVRGDVCALTTVLPAQLFVPLRLRRGGATGGSVPITVAGRGGALPPVEVTRGSRREPTSPCSDTGRRCVSTFAMVRRRGCGLEPRSKFTCARLASFWAAALENTSFICSARHPIITT
jgi:hypothetical protein